MLACRKQLIQRATTYYRNAGRINKYDTNLDFTKSLWRYSTVSWPIIDESNVVEPEVFETRHIPNIVDRMTSDCYDEFLTHNPNMEPLNTLRIHPVLAEITVAVPKNFDDELFAWLKACCDHHGMNLQKTQESLEILDRMGVPLYLSTDEDSRETGIIKCRSRDTGFFYECHILRIKKLLTKFALDYGPFQSYSVTQWNEEKQNFKSMPDRLNPNDTKQATVISATSPFPQDLYIKYDEGINEIYKQRQAIKDEKLTPDEFKEKYMAKVKPAKRQKVTKRAPKIERKSRSTAIPIVEKSPEFFDTKEKSEQPNDDDDFDALFE